MRRCRERQCFRQRNVPIGTLAILLRSAKAGNRRAFLNYQTFEVSVANTPALLGTLLDILSEQGFGSIRIKHIATWRADTQVDPAQLLAMIADIGKGRLSVKNTRKLPHGAHPPTYIANAIKFLADRI